MAEYINRELLKERFRKRLIWLKKDIHNEYSIALYDGCKYDTNLIDEIPAADVAPIVHGRWEEASDGDGIVCPFCRTDFCTIIYDTEYFNYCPNCGAKMDGGA